MKTYQIIVFALLSIIIIYTSRRVLSKPSSHGFYRFISWECIAFLFAFNITVWIKTPFAWHQIISWVLLMYSIIPVLWGIALMKKTGGADTNRKDDSLYKFEKTTKLIQSGIFKYIRHPLYSSLFFLTWGIYFKNPNFFLLIFAAISSISLILTAKTEEKENLSFFGDEYRTYMKNSKMFIPFIF